MITQVFESASEKLNAKNRKFVIELFGFDIMLDENLNCLVIECNRNPSVNQSNAYLEKFMPRMVDDFFKLALDPLFPLPKKNDEVSCYKLDGFKDDESLW